MSPVSLTYLDGGIEADGSVETRKRIETGLRASPMIIKTVDHAPYCSVVNRKAASQWRSCATWDPWPVVPVSIQPIRHQPHAFEPFPSQDVPGAIGRRPSSDFVAQLARLEDSENRCWPSRGSGASQRPFGAEGNFETSISSVASLLFLLSFSLLRHLRGGGRALGTITASQLTPLLRRRRSPTMVLQPLVDPTTTTTTESS